MSTRRFQFTVDHMVGRREIELVVTYSMTPPIAAQLYGDYPHPAEGGEVEIVSVEHAGQSFKLSQEEEDALLEQAIERSADDWAEDQIAAAEWRAQSRRDDLLMEQWEREQ